MWIEVPQVADPCWKKVDQYVDLRFDVVGMNSRIVIIIFHSSKWPGGLLRSPANSLGVSILNRIIIDADILEGIHFLTT
jgi:hypothetical protein